MDAMLEMSRGRMGMTAVLDEGGRVIGIFTDGDLRRLMVASPDVLSLTAVLTPNSCV